MGVGIRHIYLHHSSFPQLRITTVIIFIIQIVTHTSFPHRIVTKRIPLYVSCRDSEPTENKHRRRCEMVTDTLFIIIEKIVDNISAPGQPSRMIAVGIFLLQIRHHLADRVSVFSPHTRGGNKTVNRVPVLNRDVLRKLGDRNFHFRLPSAIRIKSKAVYSPNTAAGNISRIFRIVIK